MPETASFGEVLRDPSEAMGDPDRIHHTPSGVDGSLTYAHPRKYY